MIETDRIISPEGEEQEERFDRAIRPLNLEDYVGQEIVRNQMEIFIGAATKRNEPLDHTLIFGPPGLGKTTLAHIIANWTSHPVLPEPIGVIYSVDKPTYNSEMVSQVDSAIKAKGAGKVQDLLNAGDIWTVK